MRNLTSWLAPDVALVAAAVSLLYCLFLFQGYQKLFRDSDTGWHIRTGERILADGALPQTDPYSFTKPGQPWFAWEWGSDVLMGAAHRALGLRGVAMMYGVAIAATVWLWFRLNWAAGGNFLIACALAPLMLSSTNIHWLARPHVLSWIFLLVSVWYAEASDRLRPALIVAVTVVWTNIHASFFFAPLIAILYGAGHLLRPLIWDLDREAEWMRARRFGIAAVIAAAASVLNPYGWHLHQHLFRYLSDLSLLDRIGEFQSFNFHAEGATQILLALFLAMAGAVCTLAQRRLGPFFLAAFLIAAALRSARALPLVALLVLPLANAAFTAALRDARHLRPALRRTLHAFLAYCDNLRALDSRGNGLAWAPVIVLVAFAMLPARTGFPSDQFPIAATALVPEDARLMAPDKFGGYLIYRNRKVFFDGRSDFYGAEFLKQYGRMVQVRPGWRAIFDSYGFTHALLPNDYSLIPALEQLGWQRIYKDGTATLLIPPAAKG